MKRHSRFVATALAGALAIATPAVAGGLLGGFTGGAGAGVLGTAGGALSNPASNFGAAGVLGATGQFQGQVVRPITIQRPALPAMNPNLRGGAGAGGVITNSAAGVAGETGGAISAAGRNAQAAGEIGSSVSAQNRSAQATGGAFAAGGTSAGAAPFGAEGSTQAQVRAGF